MTGKDLSTDGIFDILSKISFQPKAVLLRFEIFLFQIRFLRLNIRGPDTFDGRNDDSSFWLRHNGCRSMLNRWHTLHGVLQTLRVSNESSRCIRKGHSILDWGRDTRQARRISQTVGRRSARENEKGSTWEHRIRDTWVEVRRWQWHKEDVFLDPDHFRPRRNRWWCRR